MKQIFSESELNEILHLPEVQIQRIGFSLNSEKKTLDLEMQLNANVLIVFFNVCNLTVSARFTKKVFLIDFTEKQINISIKPKQITGAS